MNKDNREFFLGTYFDRDIVLKISRLGEIFSWIVVVVYALDFLMALVVFILQYLRGMLLGMGPTDLLTSLLYIFERPFRGIVYFVALQAISKTLMILMDIEENTRCKKN